jgi:hypothetical protein
VCTRSSVAHGVGQITCKHVSRATGGLRPPLLLQSERLPAKNDFCDAETHVHESGGRQPAVVRDGPRLQRTPSDVWRRTTAEPRAAGVSPPWYVSSAIAIADAFVQRHASAARWSETTVATATRRISTFRVRIPRTSHGGLTPPALTLQYERSPAKKRFLRCTNAGSQERRASARRGSGNLVATVLVDKQPARRLCATIAVLPLQARFGNHGWLTPAAPGAPTEIVAAMRLRFATPGQAAARAATAGAFRRSYTAAICNGVLFPTGGLRPPALVAERTFAGEKTIFSMHERTLTRAAGVSPPWVLGKRTCKSASAKSLETADGVLTNAGGVAVANPRGAYAPPLLLQSERLPAKKTICAMHERTCTRAAGVSPPWV